MKIKTQPITTPKHEGVIITYCHLTTFQPYCLVPGNQSGKILRHLILNLNEFISVYLCQQFKFDKINIKSNL